MNRMQPRQREVWLIGGMALASLALAIVAAGELLSANRQFESTAADLQNCERMVGEMQTLKNRPRIASLDIESPQQTIDRVLAAQQLSTIATDSLVSVSPTAPMRLGNTDYQQRLTELVFSSVPLDKLASFTRAIDENEDGLLVSQLTLTPTPNASINASNPAETWGARLTLTQLIYSPTSR